MSVIYPARFMACVGLIIDRIERGYVNDPKDPGGETNFGISKKAYSSIDIAGLTEGDAVQIYYDDYWLACGAGSLPRGLDLWVFDCAINCGVGEAVKLLQGVCGVVQDGVMGLMTQGAAQRIAEPEMYLVARLGYYQTLSGWAGNQGGWSKRLFIIAHGC